MIEKKLPYGYRTFNGRILSNAEVDSYNEMTRQIAINVRGKVNAGYVEACRNSRHKIIAGLLAPGPRPATKKRKNT